MSSGEKGIYKETATGVSTREQTRIPLAGNTEKINCLKKKSENLRGRYAATSRFTSPPLQEVVHVADERDEEPWGEKHKRNT